MWTSTIVALACCGTPPAAAPESAVASVRSWAIESQAELKRAFGEYALIFANFERATAMGRVVYAFDRERRTATIATDDIPVLLVRGRSFWLYLWSDQDEVPFYVQVAQTRDIAIADIESLAARLQRTYPLARPDPLPTLLPVASFFPDSAACLFPASAKSCDDQEFKRLAHPDELLIGQSRQPLDPQRNPICIQFNRPGMAWNLAFDRQSGGLGMAVGVPDSTDPLQHRMILKGSLRKVDDANLDEFIESFPMLPAEAKVVSLKQLDEAYLDAMRSFGVQYFEGLRDALQAEHAECDLPALDRLSDSAGGDPAFNQTSELQLAVWRVRRAECLTSHLKSLISALQRQ